MIPSLSSQATRLQAALRQTGCVVAAACGLFSPLAAQENGPAPASPDPLDAPQVPDPAEPGPSETLPLEKAIIGAWKFVKRPLDPKAAAITSINRYTEDGLYGCSIRMEFPERERTVTIAGRWVVEDGDVIITLTHTDAPELYKIGLTFTLHDASVSGDQLHYTDAAGVEQVRDRVQVGEPAKPEAASPETGAPTSGSEKKPESETVPEVPAAPDEEAKSSDAENDEKAE